ncbi:hypothetical protein [Microbacterium flavum]|uniref:hypothetical protein n=1 Tax=Microbacterium flavum TaxID=415216 RepID=UPI0024AE5604|nr:hypothetical protein [Microbacterium flavum]
MPVLGSAQVLVATIATFCMIGLGFLYRPSRASAIWSIAFVVVLIGSSAESVAVARGIDLLRAGSTGVLLSTTAFVWSGLRAYRGAPSLVAIPSATAIAGAVILPLTLGGPASPGPSACCSDSWACTPPSPWSRPSAAAVRRTRTAPPCPSRPSP